MQVPQPNEGDSGKPIKLLDRVRNRMRVLHLSKRTEEAYVSWISRYVYFHRERRGEWVHPENLIGEDVTHFLTYLDPLIANSVAPGHHIAHSSQAT